MGSSPSPTQTVLPADLPAGSVSALAAVPWAFHLSPCLGFRPYHPSFKPQPSPHPHKPDKASGCSHPCQSRLPATPTLPLHPDSRILSIILHRGDVHQGPLPSSPLEGGGPGRVVSKGTGFLTGGWGSIFDLRIEVFPQFWEPLGALICPTLSILAIWNESRVRVLAVCPRVLSPSVIFCKSLPPCAASWALPSLPSSSSLTLSAASTRRWSNSLVFQCKQSSFSEKFAWLSFKLACSF